MIKRVIAGQGHRKVIAMDSISHVDAADAGHIVVSGSHGGVSSGEFAGRHRLAAVFFNDAGGGKENAGVAALGMLQIPAGTVSHSSARIGDAEDAWRNGVLSRVNAFAEARGLAAGQRLQDAIARLLGD